MIDFSLTPEQTALRDRVDAFIREQIIPLEGDPRQGPHGPSDDFRRELNALAQGAGLPVEFRALPEAEVRGADEIWVTSSSKEVLAIVSLDGKPVGDGKPGPAFRRMHGLYQEFKQKVMRAGKERQAA